MDYLRLLYDITVGIKNQNKYEIALYAEDLLKLIDDHIPITNFEADVCESLAGQMEYELNENDENYDLGLEINYGE